MNNSWRKTSSMLPENNSRTDACDALFDDTRRRSVVGLPGWLALAGLAIELVAKGAWWPSTEPLFSLIPLRGLLRGTVEERPHASSPRRVSGPGAGGAVGGGDGETSVGCGNIGFRGTVWALDVTGTTRPPAEPEEIGPVAAEEAVAGRLNTAV